MRNLPDLEALTVKELRLYYDYCLAQLALARASLAELNS